MYENDLRMLQDHLECLERALNAMAWLYHTGKLQQWGGLPSTGESVEKVAAGAFDAPESGSKRLKTGSRQPNQGSEKGTEKFSTGSSLLGNSRASQVPRGWIRWSRSVRTSSSTTSSARSS